MFTQEQEVKRSKEWKVVMAISSILIIVIAVFFLFRMFHSNPLEGTWVNEENYYGHGSAGSIGWQ